ncbi:MAG: hypothetical protein IJ105_02945 [Bacilli bacterium]|nr:hypothetical protein [Bacilli bacterium]
MEVRYNVIYEIKNKEILEEKELKDILAKKLLRVILTSENIASNNS